MPYIQRSVPNGILFYFFRVCQRCAYPRMGLPCLISTLLSLALRTIIHAFHHSFFPFSTSSVSSLRDHSTWEVGPLSLPASMMHPSRTSSIRRGSGTITSGQPDVLSFTPLYYWPACSIGSSYWMPGFLYCVFLLCLCRNLSLLILSSLITSSTIGYDGSMMNGLQSLPQWQSAFNNPSNGTLGVLNAITVRVFFRTANHNFWSSIGYLRALEL